MELDFDLYPFYISPPKGSTEKGLILGENSTKVLFKALNPLENLFVKLSWSAEHPLIARQGFISVEHLCQELRKKHKPNVHIDFMDSEELTILLSVFVFDSWYVVYTTQIQVYQKEGLVLVHENDLKSSPIKNLELVIKTNLEERKMTNGNY